VQQVEVAVIGTGWCGGIRAETLARSSLVDKLHICEIRPDRLAEVKALTNAATATLDYRDIVNNDRIAVVYLGRVIEEGSPVELIGSPRHPYTRALVSVIPVPETVDAGDRTVLTGEIPNPTAIPPGCRFHPRCPLYRELGEPARCTSDDPALHELAAREGDDVPHRVACHFADDVPSTAAPTGSS